MLQNKNLKQPPDFIVVFFQFYRKQKERFWKLTDHFCALFSYYFFGFDKKVQIFSADDTLDQQSASGCKDICILALYQPDAMPKITLKYASELVAQGFSVVAVVNGHLSEELKEQLLSKCLYVLTRKNAGNDFGAYQAGIHFLKKKNLLNRNVLLANDSVIFPVTETKRFWRLFWAMQTDIVGVTGNYSPFYHLQSYFVYLKKPVVQSKAFQNFWQKYQPVSSRRHAILKGEVALTECLIRAGFSCESVFVQHALPLQEMLPDHDSSGMPSSVIHEKSLFLLTQGCPFIKKSLIRDKQLLAVGFFSVLKSLLPPEHFFEVRQSFLQQFSSRK